MAQIEYLYNPANKQVFNATPELIKQMDKLKLIECPEEILKIRRPDLFGEVSIPQAPAPPAIPLAKTPPPDEKEEDQGQYLNPEGQDEGLNTSVGITMDPNRMTLLVEAIGQLDPNNKEHYTNANKPDAKVLSKMLNSDVRAAERDFAFAEYQRQTKQD